MFEQANKIAVRGLMTAACLSLLAACGGSGDASSSSSASAAATSSSSSVSSSLSSSVSSSSSSVTSSSSSSATSSSSAASPPTTPTSLNATAGNTQVSLTWSASTGATSYKVKSATTNGGPYTPIATTTSPSYTNTALTNGTTYYYVVTALNAAGESANSAQTSAMPRTWPAGDPGCGLTSAAFCDTFNAPAAAPRGRSYELDASRWSLARNQPGLSSPLVIGQANVSNCRADVPSIVYPPGDTRICDGNTDIQSNHLLTATAAQYYGTNSYRIRQPFDFAGRTGKIVFDADATANALLGWIAIAVTEDPIPSPSFSVYPNAGNFEGGVIPKNGVTVELAALCPNGNRVFMINEYRNYVDYLHDFELGGSTCFDVTHHRLNRFELRLSQTKVELWATSSSTDGTHFGTPALVASANLGLTFTRGYVQLVVHNHATTKYWGSIGIPSDAQNAWVARWDNVGFDGPVINNTREFEAPDSLVSSSSGVAVGYLLSDASATQKTSVTIHGVTGTTQAIRARLAMNLQYPSLFDKTGLASWGLRYRLNGKTWYTYTLSSQEQALLGSGITLQGDKAGQANAISNGVLGLVIDVPVADLADGDNVLEIATLNSSTAFSLPLANVDLILTNP